MPDAKQRQRVVGIGGTFFRSKRPRELADWYQKHLGIAVENNVAIFTWRPRKNLKRVGHTVWSLFPDDTRYFGSKRQKFMLNYRVRDLDEILAQLRKGKVHVLKKVEESEYGRFAWATDPEGNRFELWEPPKRGYKPSEKEIQSE